MRKRTVTPNVIPLSDVPRGFIAASVIGKKINSLDYNRVIAALANGDIDGVHAVSSGNKLARIYVNPQSLRHQGNVHYAKLRERLICIQKGERITDAQRKDSEANFHTGVSIGWRNAKVDSGATLKVTSQQFAPATEASLQKMEETVSAMSAVSVAATPMQPAISVGDKLVSLMGEQVRVSSAMLDKMYDQESQIKSLNERINSFTKLYSPLQAAG